MVWVDYFLQGFVTALGWAAAGLVFLIALPLFDGLRNWLDRRFDREDR